MGRAGGLVDLVNEETGRRQSLQIASPFSPTALAFDQRAHRLAFGSAFSMPSSAATSAIPGWRVGWWDLTTGASTTSPHPLTPTNAIAFSPDGTWIASAHADCSVYFWDLAQRVIKLEWHVGAVNSLAFSPDGELLATGSADGTVKFWPWRRLLEA
jgi:WD40 repeat protein